jgi:zinc transport system substrate-binding protein
MKHRQILCTLVCLLVAAVAAGCGQVAPATNTGADVAVTSPYLEAVVRDLLGQSVSIVPLAGPAMCPGHFDMQPSQIERLVSCRLVLRFDFQDALADKLAARLGEGATIVAIPTSGGMCDPDGYVDACHRGADALVDAGLLSRADADSRLAVVARRMAELATWMNAQIDAAHLRGTPVLASQHQEAFCRLLGLNVVATFSAADSATASAMEDAVAASEKAGVKWIIANLPEGRRMADVLADRLGATVIVFGNFPEPDEEQSFDALVRRNVNHLTAAARP